MNKPEAVLVDMDGTLTDVTSIRHLVMDHPKDFDAFHSRSVDCPSNEEAVALAHAARAAGRVVIVVTARRHRWRHVTAWWLAMHGVPSDVLIMRRDNDDRPDVEVKRDILTQIRTRWTPVLAVDDNPDIVALWKSEGIPTVVIPGWPEMPVART